MPPKAKFSKEEVVGAAISIVRRSGISALTARSLGDELGSSARPIFTVFKSMKDVQEAVIAAARGTYNEYIACGMQEDIPFKGVGKAYIRFAAQEPKFFQLLFMEEAVHIPDIKLVLGLIDENSENILHSIQAAYGFGDDPARRLYRHMWLYSHGIAVLIATKVCVFTMEEISDMLTDVCGSLIRKLKAEGA